MTQKAKYTTAILLATALMMSSCSKEGVGKTPEDAINRLITAYAANDLDAIRQSVASQHRFGSNIVEGLEWLGNCLNLMKQCIKTPVKVVETKIVGNETVVAVFANNLLGAPMSVWFVTSLENGKYKVSGMNTRLDCALKTPEQKAKDKAERQSGDYSICF